MKLFLLSFIFFALIYLAHGHTNMISINGQKDCVRPAPDGQYDSPRKDIFDSTFTCNGNNSPRNPCSINAGSTVELKWYHGGTGCIDPSHHGPITVWLSADNGQTWAKIYEEGFYEGGSSGKPGTWATDKLIARGCTLNVKIPDQLKSGRYILRTELVAHHESFKEGGAQYYMTCVDLTINGGGSCALEPRLRIPGAIAAYSDPSVNVDIYGGPGKLANYKPPGGQVAKCGSSPAPAPTTTTTPTPRPATGTTQTPSNVKATVGGDGVTISFQTSHRLNYIYSANGAKVWATCTPNGSCSYKDTNVNSYRGNTNWIYVISYDYTSGYSGWSSPAQVAL